MPKIIELKIKDNKRIYQELTQVLSSYREAPAGSMLFIVEGTKTKPIIGIRYPGKKLRRRTLKVERANSALWANLYDFEVVPYKNGKELNTQDFTFELLLRDFQDNKRNNKIFWGILEELYNNNIITKRPPKLLGIDPLLYLLVLKWIWIQEDFNYRFGWEEVESPIKYVLETRTGNRTAKGAGRAKFFAALILLRHYFSFDLVKKIIPLY
ncbi:MAG: hypothetical protein ISS45_13045 [Candidatus Omnitrophica bacterium]|nr:hypothetical protein [Candidatus Omnitrophota bacterium]